jgi:hypothetical protein
MERTSAPRPRKHRQKAARPPLGSAPHGVIRDDAGKALDPLQMRDRAVNIGQRLTTRMPSGEQPGDIRTRHAPKAGLVLLNNQI